LWLSRMICFISFQRKKLYSILFYEIKNKNRIKNSRKKVILYTINILFAIFLDLYKTKTIHVGRPNLTRLIGK
jgi:hypothetical protein